MSAACPLKASEESRRRAWRELQRFRTVLALLVDDLEPPPKPPAFEAEGAILREAMANAILRLIGQLDALEDALEKMWPYMGAKGEDGGYPNALINLNRVTNKERPPEKHLMRYARVFVGRGPDSRKCADQLK